MSKWRKRPVVVDAMQIPAYAPEVPAEFTEFVAAANAAQAHRRVEIVTSMEELDFIGLCVDSLEGELSGEYPDWLVIGTRGEPYIVAGDIFPEIYELAEAE